MSKSPHKAAQGRWNLGHGNLRRSLLASFFGTALEAYDFLLYGSIAGTILSTQFFSNASPLNATLFAFGTFAVGFIARPVGGVLIANFGDRIGRKPMLLTTLSMIGLSTFLMGFLPTYAQIGLLAPILLVVLRIIQGVAYGGEWGAAVLVVMENAPPDRRGYLCAFPQAGVPLGLVVATGMLSIWSAISGAEFQTWGWRVPFLFAAVIALIGLYGRTRLDETLEFNAMQRQQRVKRMPVVDAIRHHPREILLTTGAFMFINGGYFILVVFMIAYGARTLKLGVPVMLNAVMVASFAQIFACLLFGALSDRVGRRPVVIGGILFIALFVFPLFWMVQTRDPVFITLGMSITLIGFGAAYGPVAAMFTELFGTDTRYSGASLGYQLGAVLGGGFSPLIATALLAAFDQQIWPVCGYVILLAAVAIGCLIALKETRRPLTAEPSAANP